jgi:hypothetical protein
MPTSCWRNYPYSFFFAAIALGKSLWEGLSLSLKAPTSSIQVTPSFAAYDISQLGVTSVGEKEVMTNCNGVARNPGVSKGFLTSVVLAFFLVGRQGFDEWRARD